MDPGSHSRATGRSSVLSGRSTREQPRVNGVNGTGSTSSGRRAAPAHRARVEDAFPTAHSAPVIPETRGRNTHHARYPDVGEPSFMHETSFVRAPLNSRIDVGPSRMADPKRAKSKGKGREDALDGLPIDVQEALILDDLLYVLMGIEGTHITYPPDYTLDELEALHGVHFVVSPALDPSLADLVERILPLGTYYTGISAFIEQRSHLDFGLVNHALCAAMRVMLKDYRTLVTQLEHAFNSSSQFSLQKLWFYVHPTVHTLALLYQLSTELATADGSSLSRSRSRSPSASSSDESDAGRAEALGLGGALKAVLATIHGGGGGGGRVKGGEVLAILDERRQRTAGDPAARTLYGALMVAAGRPYVLALQAWVGAGRLSDVYEEMCVKESSSIDRGTLEADYMDEYWEKRYTLRDGSNIAGPAKRQPGVPAPREVGGRLPGGACIPPMLERWKLKILLAGKYLNVIRECGIEVPEDPFHADDSHAELSLDDEKLYTTIEDAYTHANRTLLELLVNEQQLVLRLRALRRYFFMANAASITHWLDLAHTELKKPARHASVSRLQSLLELALAGDDGAFRDDIRVTLNTTTLYDWLHKILRLSGAIDEGADADAALLDENADAKKEKEKEKEKDKDAKNKFLAIDAVAIDYTVKFPLSLIISRKTILRYQLLFRFLLHLKHAEQALCAMWADQQSAPWRVRAGPELTAWRRRVSVLRARMLAFVQHVLAFAVHDVLEPNSRALDDKLGHVRTVDGLLRDHVDFLDTCLKGCMLTTTKLVESHTQIMKTCVTFAFYTRTFAKSAAVAVQDGGGGEEEMQKMFKFLSSFEKSFDYWLPKYLDYARFYASSDNVALLPLVVRLTSINP